MRPNAEFYMLGRQPKVEDARWQTGAKSSCASARPPLPDCAIGLDRDLRGKPIGLQDAGSRQPLDGDGRAAGGACRRARPVSPMRSAG